MSQELTMQQQEAVEQVSQHVAHRLAEGTSKSAIVDELIEQEWDEDAAVRFVGQVEDAVDAYRQSPEGQAALVAGYLRHMRNGALWAIGGTVVTVWTFQAAAQGGTYVVAWGAILYGVIDFLVGLGGWLRHRVGPNS